MLQVTLWHHRNRSPPGGCLKTVQGLVFGLVKAAVDRAGARSYRAVAHENPV